MGRINSDLRGGLINEIKGDGEGMGVLGDMAHSELKKGEGRGWLLGCSKKCDATNTGMSSIVFSLFSVALKFISYSLNFFRIIFNNNTPAPSYSPNKLRFIRGEKLLSDLSTWGIGGPCNHFVQIFDHHQLAAAIRYCHEQRMRYIVVGKGSNCLFDDLGFDGCVIQNSIVFLEKFEPGHYRAGSGYPVNRLGVQSVNEGFTGLEFAAGIPGTVGGAVYMNAGANDQIVKLIDVHLSIEKLSSNTNGLEILNTESRGCIAHPTALLSETAAAVESIEIVTTKGEYKTIKRSDLSFGYRSSPFQDMNDLAAITAVTFQLKASQSAKKRQQEYLKRRKITQPVAERSAGSVFRNPPGFSAAQLVERAGLKGFKVGGTMISEKHANFFVNSGGATSRDMLELIGLAKEAVYQRFGVRLKEEILYVHPYL
ncbi:hypothetical protein CASFOL_015400 [Castilleja foliolosa]|uniref:UDP-N-acetylmuramate dehydrogenase n=1 Tax=Castilleja foliolosa TaxID=1961234 RepID=A0ABD3DFF3_9LAMI